MNLVRPSWWRRCRIRWAEDDVATAAAKLRNFDKFEWAVSKECYDLIRPRLVERLSRAKAKLARLTGESAEAGEGS